jgi:hypothetical protein
MKVTKKTKLSKIIDNKKIAKILEKYEFPCISCPFAKMEMENLDIGSICEMYDIDVDGLIKEINAKLAK